MPTLWDSEGERSVDETTKDARVALTRAGSHAREVVEAAADAAMVAIPTTPTEMLTGRAGTRWAPPMGLLRSTAPELLGPVACYVDDRLKTAGLSKEDRQAAAALLARRERRQQGLHRGGRDERHTL